MSSEGLTESVPRTAPPVDARTVRAAASGDLAAFEVLAGAVLDPAYRLAAAILGDAAEAGSAVQQVLVASWTTLPRLERPDDFDAWFRRLLVDECRMRLRQRAAAPGTGAGPAPGTTAALALLVDRAAVLDALEAAFERLDADDRAILALHELEGRPATEIGSLLHLPAGTVKLRLHEARAGLVSALETL